MRAINKLITKLEKLSSNQNKVENTIKTAIKEITQNSVIPQNYYEFLCHFLLGQVIRCYKNDENKLCLWRFFKSISTDQLNNQPAKNTFLNLYNQLARLYFFSDPLDDLTCIFVPVNESHDETELNSYLEWVKTNFYRANYPTSLLWFYALDSSISDLFPNEVIYLGKAAIRTVNIAVPDFDYTESVFLKRYSTDENDFISLFGTTANKEFRQMFSFLEREFQDRCLSRTGEDSRLISSEQYEKEWEGYYDVLRFGVSDQYESGCVSFSDLRSSTMFLNTYGKKVYRNYIQQPFFEKTKRITEFYKGRIDKFMGDNIMCIFLTDRSSNKVHRDAEVVLQNFCAVFDLCKNLYEILSNHNYQDSMLGMRTGIGFGSKILRSNLGNEIVRDFTVTGETVNFAAGIENISYYELAMHNKTFFSETIKRFPEIRELLSIQRNTDTLNFQAQEVVTKYTVYENIISNLEKLADAKFDVRFNTAFFTILRKHFISRNFTWTNESSAEIHGFDEFEIFDHKLQFYFSWYNPKGTAKFEKIWILPLDGDLLTNFNIEDIL